MFAIIVLWLALLAAEDGAAPPTTPLPDMTADQLAAYQRGQSYQRIILANEDRKWYGIALLDPLRSYLASGDSSALPKYFDDMNSFDPYLDKAPPNGSTWWFAEAGMAEVDIRGAGGDIGLRALAAAHPAWMRDHAGQGGVFATVLGLNSSNAKQIDLIGWEPALESVFEHAAPPVAFVSPKYDSTPMGYARLGISMATINEMIDSPSLLAQTDAQTFVDAFVDRVRSIADPAVPPSQLTTFRNALVVDSNFDHDSAIAVAEQTTTPFIRGLPQTDKGAFLVGLLTAQSAYNAFALKDPSASSEQLGALGSFTDLDDSDPKVHALRAKLATTQSGDWVTIIKLGRALVEEIETHP